MLWFQSEHSNMTYMPLYMQQYGFHFSDTAAPGNANIIWKATVQSPHKSFRVEVMAGWQVYYHWVNHWVNQLWSHMENKWFAKLFFFLVMFLFHCETTINSWASTLFLLADYPPHLCQCQQLHKSVWIVSKCGPSQNRTCNISPRHRGQKENVVLFIFIYFTAVKVRILSWFEGNKHACAKKIRLK